MKTENLSRTVPPGSQASASEHVSDIDAALFRKVSWRLLPILFACYVFNYLDRTNVGFAQLQMKDALGFSDTVFGLGAAIFFIGFAAFEVPSNLIMARVGARLTLFRITLLWGAASTAMMFVSTPTQFYICRFLIGVFEAGFVPGALYYISLWYPTQRRAQINALFFMAFAVAPVIAGPVAGMSLTYLDGVASLRGWQWLFLVEGIPSMLLGLVVLRWLVNRPDDAPWLTPHEKARLNAAIDRERPSDTGSHHAFGPALKDARVWLLSAACFLVVMGIHALTFWQPTMLKAMGLTPLQVGFVSVIPAVAGVLAMVLAARSSDRRKERRWHYAVCAGVGALALSATTLYLDQPIPAVVCLSLASAGVGGAFSIFWAVPGTFLQGRAAAGGLALISTLAASGGVVAPLMVALIRKATGEFTFSLYILSGALALSIPLLWSILRKRR